MIGVPAVPPAATAAPAPSLKRESWIREVMVMATKYNRESETSEAIEGRRTPWMRLGPPDYRLSHRQRFIFVVMALIAFGLLGQIAYRLNHGAVFSRQQIQRSEGVVVAREAAPGETDSGTIAVEIDTGQEKFTVSTSVPQPYWRQLKIGDRVAVLYRISKLGDSIDLVECGLVALPGENR